MVAIVVCFSIPSFARADDWPMWGRNWSHNAVSPEKGAPVDFAFERKDDNGKILPAKNLAWSSPAGGRAVGTPVVAGGLIWVGTTGRLDPKKKEDGAVLMCFRERDGKLLYQYVCPRLGEGARSIEDFPWSGMGSSPLVEGNRLWLINSRSEVVCFDTGPLKDEKEPKLLWSVDLRKEFDVVPNFAVMMLGFHASVAAYKDWLYIVTGNGIGDDYVHVASPEAPSLVCLDKANGKLVWKDNSPGKNILRCQLSTPLVMEVNGRPQVIVGQGDGWLRSFDAKSGNLLWKCDLNRKGSKYEVGGQNDRNYIVATPVAYDGRVYIATGRDIEQYEGYGCFFCIDPTKEGDVSPDLETVPGKGKPNPNSAVVWSTHDAKPPKLPKSVSEREYLFGRTISTCVICDGLVFAPEVGGYLHCYDAKTGKLHWVHDTKSSFRASPLYVDGKVYVVDDDGDVLIFACTKEEKLLAKIESDRMIAANPIFANGTLYITTENRLFAFREKK
jgi:outer membrane protein assembly factor BamB